jgi:hypothetical protein
LNSPNHTIEEKYACVENYLHGLQLYLSFEIICCNYESMIENGTKNYCERGKHAIGSHDNSNDRLYMLKYPMMLILIIDMQWHASILVL